MKVVSIEEKLNKKIVCFGASLNAEKFKKRFPLSHIVLFCDNDTDKWDTKFANVNVVSPDTLKALNFEEHVVIITSQYENEISEQLEEMDLLEFEHFFKGTYVNQYFKKPYEDGHFYSPVTELSEILRKDYRPYERDANLVDINLNVFEQQNLFEKFTVYRKEFFNYIVKKDKGRYKADNYFFSLSDAMLIYSMLKNERPNKVIEVGSGYSSAAFLDTADMLDLDTEFIFIEPYADRLKSLLTNEDSKKATIIEEKVQLVPLKVFADLQDGDILFIDSSHVAKLESDVNYLIFEVLPVLNPGVRIHIHDIFKNFEYPIKWLELGWNWNEIYVLRAFLQNNSKYKIEYFNDYIWNENMLFLPDEYKKYQEGTGASLWLRKLE